MQTIVGVLRGGPSHEHEISLKTGAVMLTHLPRERFVTHDIYIDKQGQWYDRGRATTPDRILRQIDVALLGLHGEYGEDGYVQKILERFSVPYVGADSFGAYLATHKLMAKMRAREEGLFTPAFRHIERVDDSESVVHEIIRTFHQPVVVKPVGWGSSIGVSVVGGYAHVLSAIQGLFNAGVGSVLVEEYIQGKEATVGVIEGLRGETLYTFPPIEILPTSNAYFSHKKRDAGDAPQKKYPGSFSRVDSEELQRLAKVMHRTLGLRHYSQSDFIVTPRGVYYLETDALPPLTADSVMQKSLATVGMPLPDFFTHLINLALGR